MQLNYQINKISTLDNLHDNKDHNFLKRLSKNLNCSDTKMPNSSILHDPPVHNLLCFKM